MCIFLPSGRPYLRTKAPQSLSFLLILPQCPTRSSHMCTFLEINFFAFFFFLMQLIAASNHLTFKAYEFGPDIYNR
jgi:hypothetical protein